VKRSKSNKKSYVYSFLFLFRTQQREPKYIKKYTSKYFQCGRQLPPIQWSISDRVCLWTTFHSLKLRAGRSSLFDVSVTLSHAVTQKKELTQSKWSDLSLCLLKIAQKIEPMQELYHITHYNRLTIPQETKELDRTLIDEFKHVIELIILKLV